MRGHHRTAVAGGVLLAAAAAALPAASAAAAAVRESTGSERAPEDPAARAQQRLWQLRDPATGRVPRGIAAREKAFVAALAARRPVYLRPLVQQWRHRGPASVGGRTRAVAVDVRDERVIVAGGVSGGVWRSADGGATWRKTTAPDQVQAVSAIVQNTAPGHGNVWYYGTGVEPAMGGSAAGPLGTDAAYLGDGIYRSDDGGRSWSVLPSTRSGTPTARDDFDFVWRLATFGTDGVLAATSTGVFRSTDGGATWSKTLDLGDGYDTVASYLTTDVAVAADGTVYAAVGGTGPVSSLYRSLDGGATFAPFNPPGWPATTDRTVIGVAPSDPGTVYFFTAVGGLDVHLYRYAAAGGWTDLAANLPFGDQLGTYGGSVMLLAVKPDDPDTIFLGAIDLYRSSDGGASFETVGSAYGFHVDQHAAVFYPSDPDRLIVGNDGGLYRTAAAGAASVTWESLDNGYLTSQFYTVAVDHDTPGSVLVAGGMQDNGCAYSDSAAPGAAWTDLLWGDGGFVAVADGGHYQYTSLAATLRVTRHSVEDGVEEAAMITPEGAKMGLWLAPFLLDPDDDRVMYLPARRDLWRNSDVTAIPYVLPPVPTSVNWTRLENVDTLISALGMSPAMPARLYYGGFNGDLERLDGPRTGQPVPTALPRDGLPLANRSAYVGCIAVDPRDSAHVFVVYPNYHVISIFESTDAGMTWTGVSGNLEEHPDGSGAGPSVRWLAILYVGDRPVYLAATSAGLFSARELAGMDTVWVQEGAADIGSVVVDMVDVRQSDGFVAVGTHGYGVFDATLDAVPSMLRHRLSSEARP